MPTIITNINSVSSNTFEYQEYSATDTNLIASTDVSVTFDPSQDYFEYFIFDTNSNLLYSNINNYTSYSIINNDITINAESDLVAQGYNEGQYNTHYNFLRKKLSSSPVLTYYISEISSDRTELRLASTIINPIEIVSSSLSFMNEISSSVGYYLDFYLDFGSNKLVIANNCLLDNSNPSAPTILIKLYEALPPEFDIKSICWVVEEIANPISYNIQLTAVFDSANQNIQLQGPNFNLSIKDEINNSTNYFNQNGLQNTPFSLGSGSFTYQVNSLLGKNGISINVDYSNYSDFIHFSSAQTRLENFYYKLSLIEQYSNSASFSNGVPLNITSSNALLFEQNIQNVIQNFDEYEYYLYFNSGSSSWPKSNAVPPYQNVYSTSSIGQNWLMGQLSSASLFDNNNKDALILSIPSYLRDDSNNQQYMLFVEMLGQHYDSIWIYYKDVTNKFDKDNRLNYGISKDLVATAIKDLGVKIYQNNFSTNDLYSAFLGITPSGSLLGLPFTTGSLPVPPESGLEYIQYYVTASLTSSLLPTDDVNKSIYKRIYNNLPFLLKKKGTVPGLQKIITLYGIPDTILRVKEFGGQYRNNPNYDHFQRDFNYAFNTSGSGYVSVPWQSGPLSHNYSINFGPTSSITFPLSSSFINIGGVITSYPSHSNLNNFISNLESSGLNVLSLSPSLSFYSSNSLNNYIQVTYDDGTGNFTTTAFVKTTGSYPIGYFPEAVEFRFQANKIPSGSFPPLNQELINLSNNEFNVVLEYTGSGNNIITTYSGSIVDPYYNYATLKFYHSSSNQSASLYLPFYNGNWWSVLINAASSSGSTTYTLYSGDKIYEGADGNQLGFNSSSLFSSSFFWNINGNLYLGASGSSIIRSKTYSPFSGSLQEFRYYSVALSQSVFNDYVMNPYSIEGNSVSGSEQSLYTLSFRAPLGSELDNDITIINRVSVHPAVTGSLIPTSSFQTNSNYTLNGNFNFIPNIEYIYENQFSAGTKNSISEKIRIENSIFPASGGVNIPNQFVLSPFISIQQSPQISSSYTKDIDYVETAFSPQNEIDSDIIDQLGWFNIGDYIGDPRQQQSTNLNYPDLDKLRNTYFEKYLNNYNIWDYVRLIEFYDNSLFKMIKDWVPARASLSSGIVIKPTFLERSKYPVPQVSFSSLYLTGSIKSSPSQSDYQQIYIDLGKPVESFSGSDGGTLPPASQFVFSTSSFTFIGGTSSMLPINLGGPTIFNVTFNVFSNGGNANLEMFEGNEITSSLTLLNSFLSKTSSIFYNKNFNSTTGFISFCNSINNSVSIRDITVNNLIVTRLQGYTETIPTISGSVSRIVLNDDFYNGEFSGSAFKATTQSLNPNNPFLYYTNNNIQYTPIFYSDLNFIFVSGSSNYLPNTVFSDTFLNENNAPKKGEILFWTLANSFVTSQIHYVKIAKIDSSGMDQSPFLQQVKDFKIIYTDINIQKYTITNIKEFPSYYLYYVELKNSSISTADNKILNYRIDAFYTLDPHPQGGDGAATFNPIISYGVTVNPLGYFNPLSGSFKLNNQPNIDLIFSGSAVIRNNTLSSSIVTLALVNYNNLTGTNNDLFIIENLIVSQSVSSGSAVLLSISGIISASYLPVGYSTCLATSNVYGGFNYATHSYSNVTFFITQSVDAQNGNQDLTILEPYINSTFYNSDFNVIINNVEESPNNSIYQEVSYIPGQITAENQQAILNNSAPKAEIPNSYYTQQAQINPRYNGVESSGSLQTYNNYFAYYDWIGASFPEIVGGGNVHIIKIVDQNGTIFSPDSGILNLYDIQSIFKSGDTASLYFLTGSSSTQNSEFKVPIIAGGSLYQTIMRRTSSIEGINFNWNEIGGGSGTSTGINNTITLEYDSISQSLYISKSLSDGGVLQNLLGPFISTDAIIGSISYSLDSYQLISPTSIQIYNTATQTILSDGLLTSQETLLPFQVGDILRLGTDTTLFLPPNPATNQTFMINKINSGSEYGYNSISPILTGSLAIATPPSSSYLQTGNQAFLFYRRLDNPFFVVIQILPSNYGPGLIIPANYNPNLNFLQLAKKAGII